MIEELYQTYYRELTDWCRSMTGNEHTAQELVQEAFLRAMLHEDLLGQLREGQRRAWLYRTVKNLYVDRIRHGGRESIVEELPPRQTYPEEILRWEWEEVLRSLPDGEGTILSMRYLEGYNSRQIGEILSLPPGTVRSRLSDARRHLKEALGGKRNV